MTVREKPRVRELNLLRVFREIRAGGKETTTELIRSTGLSRPSVTSLVIELIELGWIEVVDPASDGQGGRPPQRFCFRAQVGTLVGIDIGVHRISVLLADLAGEVLFSRKFDVEPTATPTERLAAVDAALETTLSEADVSADAIWAVGAAVTGPVDADGRTSMVSPLPDWAEVDLVAHLAQRFSCPIRVENDVKLALLAEHEWGVARGASDVVFILAGQRTGAASMVNGQVVRGHGGAAGEIGALPAVRWHTAIERLHPLTGSPASLKESERAAWTFEQAQRSNAEAKKLVWKYARDVATGAAAVVLTLDPEIVVLGGGSTQWASLWIAEFSAVLNKSVVRMPEVRVSTIGGDHVARGAIRLAMAAVENSLYGDKLLPPLLPAATV
ncbi:putative NBD/HSP70 family sugar kinase [Mycetocola sp. CAN_C7]|uniref:ROK family transcriptional regulator n=1 Tax=Mycetocola sp. CAN_C7 TaxID=2787724 RepID=UPI0018CAEDF0